MEFYAFDCVTLYGCSPLRFINKLLFNGNVCIECGLYVSIENLERSYAGSNYYYYLHIIIILIPIFD